MSTSQKGGDALWLASKGRTVEKSQSGNISPVGGKKLFDPLVTRSHKCALYLYKAHIYGMTKRYTNSRQFTYFPPK